MANKGLKEYWAGYRNARIVAYLMAHEHSDELIKAHQQDGKGEQFMRGFVAGLDALLHELSDLLDQEAAYMDDSDGTASAS